MQRCLRRQVFVEGLRKMRIIARHVTPSFSEIVDALGRQNPSNRGHSRQGFVLQLLAAATSPEPDGPVSGPLAGEVSTRAHIPAKHRSALSGLAPFSFTAQQRTSSARAARMMAGAGCVAEAMRVGDAAASGAHTFFNDHSQLIGYPRHVERGCMTRKDNRSREPAMPPAWAIFSQGDATTPPTRRVRQTGRTVYVATKRKGPTNKAAEVGVFIGRETPRALRASWRRLFRFALGGQTIRRRMGTKPGREVQRIFMDRAG